MLRHVLRFFGLLLVVAIVGVAAAGGYVRVVLGRSLPVTEGTVTLVGLTAPVTVTRDSVGVPTITAATRTDLARAIGFVHAQERFFQMDLQRRQPAGELSALVGRATLDADRAMRVHRFRAIAERAVTLAPADYRAELDAYAAGVNAGLAALGAPPFEYLALRTTPERWTPADSVLTALAMSVTLQGSQADYEETLGTLHDLVPSSAFEFLAGRASDWEAPIVGPPRPVPPIPPAADFEIRTRTASRVEPDDTRSLARDDASLPTSLPWWLRLPREDEAALGSNNWAVAGRRSETGAAMVANDMHLRLSVPNIWYRAAFVLPDDRRPDTTRRLVGVTLPGGPQMAVGSNGDIAWGFTNSVGDWSDLVVLEPVPGDETRYQTPDGPRAFEHHRETIVVKGADPVPLDVRWTVWGPVLGRDHRGRERALKWVAHDATVLATDAARVAHARSVDEAMRTAVGASLAAQNLVVGDREGHIGWTIYGAIPRRIGFAGDVPTSWADGSRRWEGYLSYDEHPRVVDPPDGQLWTANARVVEGEMMTRIGDGGYSDGIRARLIRDRLSALDRPASERDLFDIQLEDRALFLERWRSLLLTLLTSDAVAASPTRAETRRVLETDWTGRASPSSVAYRVVRTFRLTTSRMVMEALTARVRAAAPDLDLGTIRRVEGPLWRVVAERPLHLLDPAYATWDAFLLAALDRTLAALTSDGAPLSSRTWGEANTADITHPLAAVVPLAGRWLSMPREALSGDVYVPRVTTPRSGASQRLVVSPGHEARGVLHMPGGQSAHPLSRHFADQQGAWVRGEWLPLLPQTALHTLTLRP